jgi:hypothetical protein
MTPNQIAAENTSATITAQLSSESAGGFLKLPRWRCKSSVMLFSLTSIRLNSSAKNKKTRSTVWLLAGLESGLIARLF